MSGTGDAIASGGSTAISGYVNELNWSCNRPPRATGDLAAPGRRDPAPGAVLPAPGRGRAAAGGGRQRGHRGAGPGADRDRRGRQDPARRRLRPHRLGRAAAVDLLVWVTASTRVGDHRPATRRPASKSSAPTPTTRSRPRGRSWPGSSPKPAQKPCRWLIVLDDLADPGRPARPVAARQPPRPHPGHHPPPRRRPDRSRPTPYRGRPVHPRAKPSPTSPPPSPRTTATSPPTSSPASPPTSATCRWPWPRPPPTSSTPA